MRRTLVTLAALFGFLSVLLGAFGAHALRGALTDRDLATFETAVRYQMFHSLAMLTVGLAIERIGRGSLAVLGLWLAGIVIFCGSLYIIVFSGVRAFGALAPVGGLSFMAGWLFLAVLAFRTGGFRSP